MEWLHTAAAFWWSRLPRRLAQRWRAAAFVLLDGSYVTASTAAAAIVPPVALAIGGLLGWAHLDYPPQNSTVYIYSLVTLVVLILISFHGAALGLYAWVGYAFSDFFLYALGAPDVASHTSGLARLLQIVETRALADLLLAFLIVAMPFTVRTVVRLTFGWPRSRPPRRWIAVLSAAVLAFTVVYLWLQSAGLLLQAVYIWQGYGPMTHNLVQVRLPDWMLPLSCIAAYVAGTSVALEDALDERSHARAMALYGRVLTPARATSSLAWDLISAVVRALALTLLLGSVIRSWSNAAALLTANIIVLCVHAFASRFTTSWLRSLSAFPVLARFVAALICGFLLTQLMFQSIADSFVATQAAAVAALIVFAVLFPARSGPTRPARGTAAP